MQTTPRQEWLSFPSLSFCLQVYFTSRATHNLNTPTDLTHVYKNRCTAEQPYTDYTDLYPSLHWNRTATLVLGQQSQFTFITYLRAELPSLDSFFWVFAYNGFDWKGLKGLSGSVLRIFANIGLEQHYIILLSTNLTLRSLNQPPHPNISICFLLLIIYSSLTPAY